MGRFGDAVSICLAPFSVAAFKKDIRLKNLDEGARPRNFGSLRTLV
jgi:hypothetical protein